MSDSSTFSQDFREFVELLNRHEVKYLVTGGYAVGVYGHPLRIDVLTSIDGVEFKEAWPNRNVIEVDQMPVNFIGLEELKINKKASGRGKDLDDLMNLEK